MYRLLTIALLILVCHNAKAQVGINTSNPLGVLHIDPKGDTKGSITNPTNDSDDVFVSSDGKLGIGTINPKAKVSVISNNEDGSSGLYLPNGAEISYIFTSDTDGNGVWRGSPPIQYHTFVANPEFADQVVTGQPLTGMHIKTFGKAIVDSAKEYFGQGYGWNEETQQYKAPKKGLYRITSQVYCLPNVAGLNYKTYWYLNNTMTPRLGFYAYYDTGIPISAYTSNVVDLEKDDVIDVRLYSTSGTVTSINYRQGMGHSYIIVEILQ